MAPLIALLLLGQAGLITARYVIDGAAHPVLDAGLLTSTLALCLIMLILLWQIARLPANQSDALIEWIDQIDISADEFSALPRSRFSQTPQLLDSIQTLVGRLHDYRDKLLIRHQRVQRLLRNVTDVLYHIDHNARLTWVTDSVSDMLGYSSQELRGYPLARLLADPTADLPVLTQSSSIVRYPTRVFRRDGSVAWLLISARRIDDAEGRVIGSEGICRDGTRLIETQRQLNAEKERAQVTLAAIGDGVITTSAEGAIIYANPRAQRILSRAEQELEGRLFDEVCRLRDPENNQIVAGLVDDCLRDVSARDMAQTLVLNDEETQQSRAQRWITINVSPIRDEQENVTGTVIVLHDVTRLHRISRELTYQANHDSLTGLLNRRAFEQRLRGVLDKAREHGTQHALCYIDLDQFKLVNDSCGHHAGDAMLRQLSSRMMAELRPGDTLARLGGDEFGLIMEDTDLEAAEGVAERLRTWIEGFRFNWQGRVFRLGASIGLAGIDADSLSTAELLRQADTACYLAKEQGRNHVQVYRYDSDEARMRDYEIERMQQISEALDSSGFELFAQPIYPLNDEQRALGCGLELLLRLNKQDETSTPQNLLLTAERYSVAPRIDRWVINNALALIVERESQLTSVAYYSINISGQSITDEHFVGFVRERIERSGVDPSRLVFEITETAAVTNLQRAGELMRSLRAIGCRFALDDFGSGLSSFSYLKHLPSDFVKIDGKLVKHIIEDPVEHSIIEAIGRVSKALKLQTVAEHVETQAQFEALEAIGIDYVQGFYIGHPLPFRQLDDTRYEIA